MLIQSDNCPWNVPVPVEPGRFVSVFPEHEQFNVQVTSSQPFGCDETRYPAESLLFADLQSSLHCHVTGRLGSGRSGFFRNRYLKGVGRTPLAANWNNRDFLHNTGHLAASSAIREYVVSRYLTDMGCEDSIVGCEGVLLAELDPRLRNYERMQYRGKEGGQLAPVDRYLQAISVKRGGFARQSNFLWMLSRLTPATIDRGRTGLGTFCELLIAALTPPGEAAPLLSESTPASMAALLRDSVARACEQFSRWFDKGVWWGSFMNNFTIDGRFLDLETPALLGGPCFGYLAAALPPGRARGVESGMVGTELFIYVEQAQLFCRELQRVLSNLPIPFSATERGFAAELAREIEEQVLSPHEILGSPQQAVEAVQWILDDAFGPIAPGERAKIARLVELTQSMEIGGLSARKQMAGEVEFSEVRGAPWMLTEPGLRWRPFAMQLGNGRMLGPSEEERRQSRFLAELIVDLDNTTSLSELLDKLANLPSLTGKKLPESNQSRPDHLDRPRLAAAS